MGGPLWNPVWGTGMPAYLVLEFANNINVFKNRFLPETRRLFGRMTALLFALMVYHGFLCLVHTLFALVRLFCELFPKTPDSLGFYHSLL